MVVVGLGGTAARPVGDLVDELRTSLPHLAAAKDAEDARTLQHELAAGAHDLGSDRPKAVRAALGLGTDDSRANRPEGPGGSGGCDGTARTARRPRLRGTPAAGRPCGSEYPPPD
ncbi:hypothetical protein [Kitasatospora sp. NPDC059571]|uniref:hypothetical protein n=1 Tax=Kitasatospora sp. NPDC059571 TaxID=3346871 RepID=UPI003693F3C4